MHIFVIGHQTENRDVFKKKSSEEEDSKHKLVGRNISWGDIQNRDGFGVKDSQCCY